MNNEQILDSDYAPWGRQSVAEFFRSAYASLAEAIEREEYSMICLYARDCYAAKREMEVSEHLLRMERGRTILRRCSE